MTSRVLVVADVVARGRDTALLPKLTHDGGPRGPMPATLVTPDGETRVIELVVDVAHQRGPLPPFALLRVLGVPPEEIAIGSTVRW